MTLTHWETLDQKEQPAALEEEAGPSPVPFPQEMGPLQVVQDYVAAINSGTLDQKLADVHIVSFYNHSPQLYHHQGFMEVSLANPEIVQIYKSMLNRDWLRQRKLEELMMRQRAAAPSLHLRAESDDEEEEPPGRCSPQLALPPPPQPEASQEVDQLKFLETKGVLTDYDDEDEPFEVILTLGYRQVPVPSANGQTVEICVAKYQASWPSLQMSLFPDSP